MAERCLVTGGGGFVGARAVRALTTEGRQVAVIARPGESLWRLADLEGRFEAIEADLADRDRMAGIVRDWRPDAALHCAWYVEPGLYPESPKNIDCLMQSVRLAEDLIAASCRRIVMVGTCAEYDTDAGFLREDGPVRPATLYAATKLATRLIVERLAERSGAALAWARLFYLYGPDEDPRRLIPALIRALLEGREFPATDGEQVRDYLHIDDAAAGLAELVGNGVPGVFNICSGEGIRLRRIMQMIGDQMGKAELIRFGSQPRRDWEPPFICGDNSRMRSLGWRPGRDLAVGLRETIEYWRGKP
jgi:nucleoside-diphosphate-sugar epimerase